MQIYIKTDKIMVMSDSDGFSNKFLVLDITGNYSRVERYAMQNNRKRVEQFLNEAFIVLEELKERKLSDIGQETLEKFDDIFIRVHNPKDLDKYYIDDVITLDTILTGRASLF